MMQHVKSRAAVLLAAVALMASLPAAAQAPRPAAASPAAASPAAASPFQGMGQSQDQPVQIEAAALEVRDKNKTATFSGNVQVVQGDTTMKCQSLIVFYGQEVGIGSGTDGAAAMPKTAPGMPQNAQNIRRIEARGGVTVITKDQNASGDLGVYDLKSKTITLSGNVVVSQGQNVIHGERVVVDTATGNARVESGSTAAAGIGTASQSRVRALIQPGKTQNGGTTNFMTLGPGKAN
jgi:lipopolysaccharide export system protein LptA